MSLKFFNKQDKYLGTKIGLVGVVFAFIGFVMGFYFDGKQIGLLFAYFGIAVGFVGILIQLIRNN